MPEQGNLFRGIFLASLAAGPILMITDALATYYLQLPMPGTIDVEMAANFVGTLIPASIFGTFVALAFNAAGAVIMIRIGEHWIESHSPGVWIAVGTLTMLAGPAIVGFEQFSMEMLIAMGVTGGSCAGICYYFTESPQVD
ncbi:hypothetical protein HFP51_04615 [Parasphingopyxis sp. CP4]|uniref:hypothetical protein n=1 Tax=Parasphingopyxis sp. CP4 TaxID=2724527 RepID=UPI0015A0F982|nr:hypothetical protein [Parasphingopyxis sp. CP4]QLC21521.1 hypothetical protein HFP51_04615 [Parasphingopyxis sp. CP4]